MSDAVSPGRTMYELAKTAEGMVATAVAPSAAAAKRDFVGIRVPRVVRRWGRWGNRSPIGDQRSVGTAARWRQALKGAVTVSSQRSPLCVNFPSTGASATLNRESHATPEPATHLATDHAAGGDMRRRPRNDHLRACSVAP